MPKHYQLDETEIALVFALRKKTINRVEVIVGSAGRVFVAHETLNDVEISVQDDGGTLKIFAKLKP